MGVIGVKAPLNPSNGKPFKTRKKRRKKFEEKNPQAKGKTTKASEKLQFPDGLKGQEEGI